MNFFLYILYSPAHNRTYTGQTKNLEEMIDYHNAGKVRSTKPYIPWKLIYSETYSSRVEAMKREKWFKSNIGRKKIAEILNEYLQQTSKL